MVRKTTLLALAALALPAAAPAQSAPTNTFQPLDVFNLERATDPQISPDGKSVVYTRSGYDIMRDGGRSNLWVIGWDGTGHRPLTTDGGSSPRWSPSGDRLAYVARGEHGTQIFIRWMDTGQTMQVTHLQGTPSGISWSPDGSTIAFTMFVPEHRRPLVRMPAKPPGADWGPEWKYIDKVQYRADGRGYLPDGHSHVFVVPAEGGAARQLTTGPWDHRGTPEWTPDGRYLLISANRHEDAAYSPSNSEIYEVAVEDGSIRALTDREGPDNGPTISPDGSMIAYTGYDDHYLGYQQSQLWVMGRDGSNPRLVTGDLDRSVGGLTWAADGKGLYTDYGEEGTNKIVYIGLDGRVTQIADHENGLSMGRPYAAGQFSATPGGRFAFTQGNWQHPADLAVVERGGQPRRLTDLNDDVLGHEEIGQVESFWYESSYDGKRIQGWIMKPPGFDPSHEYPMILEIHGGPFAMYGDVFAAELQLMAAQGYVVLYTNPRGSTGYGKAFGNEIHHAYPGHDYDDLMSGVDAVLGRGYVDADQLYVTGGSGGGVLSAWIVGKTHRFRAAVVQKPVINWYSFVLHADGIPFFYKYWFSGFPWDHRDEYMDRSPISLAGNVTTPTMLITGEQDYRTPSSEAEQFYAALKLRKVDAAMVRVPDSGHGIANKPSNLIEKVEYILAWFDQHSGKDDGGMAAAGGR